MKRPIVLLLATMLLMTVLSPLHAETDNSTLPPIIFVKQTPVESTDGTIASTFTNIEGANPRSAQPTGGGLFRLDPDGTLTNLTPNMGQIAVRDPEISYDAQRVLFSMKIGAFGKWHIYEVNVDGTNMRKITEGDANYWDAGYLSDGRIVYLSDVLDIIARRNLNLPPDHLAEGRVHIMDSDGNNARPINFNPNGSFNPILSQSGQIIFTQWDLNDLRPTPDSPPDGMSYSRFTVWEMLVDGSREGHPIFGAHLVPEFGGGFMDVREFMDDSGEMLGTLTQSQMTYGAGAIVRFMSHGAQDAQSYTAITPEDAYLAGSDHADVRYRSPYPLPDGSIIASYAEGAVYEGQGIPNFDLVLLNDDGTHSVIHSDPDMWDWHAVAVVPRTAPDIVQPMALDDSLDYAIINTADVELRNRNADTVLNGDFQPMIEQGDAAFVRIFNLTRPPAPYAGGDPNDQEPRSRLLGQVAVQEDGSFAAIVPAQSMLIWDVVDAEGNVLVAERVWQELAPGEVRSCGGCHTPDAGGGRTSNMALANPVNLTRYNVDTNDDGTVDLLEKYYEAIAANQQ